MLGQAGYVVSKCGVRKLEDHLECFDGHIYWFNDCNQPFVIEELCTCGCTNGTCDPFESCPLNGGINVQLHSDVDRCEPEDAVFLWATATGGDSESYVYEWDFGFGATSALSEVTQWFPVVGFHPVVVVVSDDEGRKGVAAKKIQVGNQAPVIEVEEIGSEFDFGEEIVFTCEAIDAEDGELSGGSIIWSNGDIGNTAIFKGLSANMHTITVTATDSERRATTNSFAINVVQGACYPIQWEANDIPEEAIYSEYSVVDDPHRSGLAYILEEGYSCVQVTCHSLTEANSSAQWTSAKSELIRAGENAEFTITIVPTPNHVESGLQCLYMIDGQTHTYTSFTVAEYYMNTIITAKYISAPSNTYPGSVCNVHTCESWNDSQYPLVQEIERIKDRMYSKCAR